MKQAVAYFRVSTEGQAVHGVSLAAQEEKIGAWANLNNYTVVGRHVDAGISGGRADNRPGLQKALEQAKVAKAALVVYSLSRLARSTMDAIAISQALEKAGADLVSLTERIDTTSASGKMVFRMMAVLAEFERDQISERTRMGMAHLKRQGRWIGRVPYGSTLSADGKWLEPNEAERKVVEQIRVLRQGGQSLRQIARTLERKGIKPKSASRWHPQVVHRLLGRLEAA